MILNWVVQPQREWFYNPKNIILFNNLNYEWKFICNELSIGDGVIGNFNESKKSKSFFSIESSKFINEFYKEDFIIWNYWSKLPIEERINIDWSKHESFSNRL